MFSMGANMAANAPNYQPSPRSAGLHPVPAKAPGKPVKPAENRRSMAGFAGKPAPATAWRGSSQEAGEGNE
jgi:hypothetical protein